MNTEITKFTRQKPQSPKDKQYSQKDIIRNFQQLLKLKLMREQRKKVLPVNPKQSSSLLTIAGEVLVQQKTSKKKTFQFKSTQRQSSSITAHETSNHLKVNSMHVRTEASQLINTSKHRIFTQRNRYERRSQSQRNNILTHLQQARSIQQKYLRSKDKLIDQKQISMKKRSVVSLQSIGTGIHPLTPPNMIVNLHQLLKLRLLDKQVAEADKQKMKKSSRYNDIPISEFLYENSRRSPQVIRGIQRKIESICRTQEKTKTTSGQK